MTTNSTRPFEAIPFHSWEPNIEIYTNEFLSIRPWQPNSNYAASCMAVKNSFFFFSFFLWINIRGGVIGSNSMGFWIFNERENPRNVDLAFHFQFPPSFWKFFFCFSPFSLSLSSNLLLSHNFDFKISRYHPLAVTTPISGDKSIKFSALCAN